MKYLWILLAFLPTLASAIETQKLPLCSDHKEIRVPKPLQGAYATESYTSQDPANFEVGPRGIIHQDETIYPILDHGMGSRFARTEADLVKEGYCRFTELSQNADGSLELTTTVRESYVGIQGAKIMNYISTVKYIPGASPEERYQFKFREGGGMLAYWIIPLAGGDLISTFRSAVKLN